MHSPQTKRRNKRWSDDDEDDVVVTAPIRPELEVIANEKDAKHTMGNDEIFFQKLDRMKATMTQRTEQEMFANSKENETHNDVGAFCIFKNYYAFSIFTNAYSDSKKSSTIQPLNLTKQEAKRATCQ